MIVLQHDNIVWENPEVKPGDPEWEYREWHWGAPVQGRGPERKAVRSKKNPRQSDVGILPHKEHLMTELVEGDRAHVAEGVGLLGTLKNLGGGFWEVVPYFDEEKPLTFHVNQVLYRDRIRMFDSKHPKHLIWRWQLGELASDNSRARRNPKGRSADSRLNPARRNGFTRGFPVAQKAFTVMWEHQRGKRGDLMGLPGSGDYTYYRHFDPRKDRYESMSWPAARAGKFIAELNRMGIKDDRILVLGARGEEIDPAGLKETYRKMTAGRPGSSSGAPVDLLDDPLAHVRADLLRRPPHAPASLRRRERRPQHQRGDRPARRAHGGLLRSGLCAA
jgi:hypothetical protein